MAAKTSRGLRQNRDLSGDHFTLMGDETPIATASLMRSFPMKGRSNAVATSKSRLAGTHVDF